MIGEPSIDMSMTPPHERSSRTFAKAGEHGEQLAHHLLDQRQVSALGVGVVAVEIAAED